VLSAGKLGLAALYVALMKSLISSGMMRSPTTLSAIVKGAAGEKLSAAGADAGLQTAADAGLKAESTALLVSTRSSETPLTFVAILLREDIKFMRLEHDDGAALIGR
jgi:hypothetical protein